MPSLFFPIGYLPPTYLPPTYFPVSGTVPSFGSAPISGDPEIMDDIVDRLRATGAFCEVEWGLPIDEMIPAVDMLPCASVEFLDSEENDSEDSDTVIRDARFTVTIATKAHEPREAQAQALQLSSVVANAIGRKQLAGVTWIPWTKIGKSRFDKRKHPESRLTMTGTYRVEINRSYNHYEVLDI